MQIRPANTTDFDAIWAIFRQVIAGGDTYTFDENTTPETARTYWLGSGVTTFVATDDHDTVLGVYRLVANQPGRGNHVANASFIVDPSAVGRGVGRAMGGHCVAEAKRLGFRAMQFNIVVATNDIAVRLWQRLGFEIVGTLPGAYRHRTLGYVDAYVMYRVLDDDDDDVVTPRR